MFKILVNMFMLEAFITIKHSPDYWLSLLLLYTYVTALCINLQRLYYIYKDNVF